MTTLPLHITGLHSYTAGYTEPTGAPATVLDDQSDATYVLFTGPNQVIAVFATDVLPLGTGRIKSMQVWTRIVAEDGGTLTAQASFGSVMVPAGAISVVAASPTNHQAPSFVPPALESWQLSDIKVHLAWKPPGSD